VQKVLLQGGRSMYGVRIRTLRDVFSAMEMHGDGDGLVSFAEFADGLERLAIKVPRAQLYNVFTLMDVDLSGVMSWDEFEDVFEGAGAAAEQKRQQRKERKEKQQQKAKEDAATPSLRRAGSTIGATWQRDLAAQHVKRPGSAMRGKAKGWMVIGLRTLYDPVPSSKLLRCPFHKIKKEFESHDASKSGCLTPGEWHEALLALDPAMPEQERMGCAMCVGWEPRQETVDYTCFLDAFQAYRDYRGAVRRLVRAVGSRTLFGEKLGEVQDLFRALDRDGDGTVCSAEFMGGLRRLGLPLSDAQLMEVFEAIDFDNSDSIGSEELVLALKSHASKISQDPAGAQQEAEVVEAEVEAAPRRTEFREPDDVELDELAAADDDSPTDNSLNRPQPVDTRRKTSPKKRRPKSGKVGHVRSSSPRRSPPAGRPASGRARRGAGLDWDDDRELEALQFSQPVSAVSPPAGRRGRRIVNDVIAARGNQQMASHLLAQQLDLLQEEVSHPGAVGVLTPARLQNLRDALALLQANDDQ